MLSKHSQHHPPGCGGSGRCTGVSIVNGCSSELGNSISNKINYHYYWG